MTVAPASLTFDSTNWNTPQNVTVTTLNDVNLVVESINISASSALLITASTPISKPEDDTQLIVVSGDSNVIEGTSSSTLNVQFAFEPPASSTVTLTLPANTGISFSSGFFTASTSITLTALNWNTGINVSYYGIEDANTISENITLTTSSAGVANNNYNLTSIDNDVQQILLSGATSVTEGSSSTVNVKLLFNPNPSTVSVTLSFPSDQRISFGSPGYVGSTTISLDSSNWSTGINVTIYGLEDTNNANESVTLSASSTANTTATRTINSFDAYPILTAGGSGYWGNSITITGTGFLSPATSNAVTIGGVTATVSSGSGTSLTVVIPFVAGGAQALFVSNTRGSVTLVGSVNVLLKLNCKDILNSGLSMGNTAYYIDPDGGSTSNQFMAYCDMTTSGGGWTLALKADGNQPTFVYGANYWTTNNTYGTGIPDTSFSEYKSQSFNTVPFTEILLRMNTSGTIRDQTFFIAKSSLLQLFQGGYISTSIARNTWKSLLPNSSLQTNCSREGFNIDMTALHLIAT